MVTADYTQSFELGFFIRRSNPCDIPEIVSIEQEMFTDPWGDHGIREAMGLYLSSFFVAIADGHIIGFCGGGIEDTGDVIYGHLCTLAVSTGYRNRGVGRALVRRIEHDFLITGATAVELEVRTSNRDAIAFYRKLGYHEVFIYERYYKDGEDGIVMMKWFST